MDLTPEQIRGIFVYVFALVVSIALHEFGHAKMGDLLGDPTPRRQGRVTLNPLAHADPIGTFLLPLAGAVYGAHGGGGGGFGWGKPVMTEPRNYTRRWSMATGQVFVALAGPIMNVVLATVIATTHVILIKTQVLGGRAEIDDHLLFAVGLNFTLFFFNLVPVPPLDGGWVAQRFLPRRFQAGFEEVRRYGMIIVVTIAVVSPLNKIFLVPAGFCTEHLYRALASLVLS
jgi:Zn-dependent protease